jgi:hypothetical protein
MHDVTWYLTEDGSFSVKDPIVGEGYHNKAGAITEALVHFAWPALAAMHAQGLLNHHKAPSDICQNLHISLVDSCFGLGYNTWLFMALLHRLYPEKPLKLSVYALDSQFPGYEDFHRILKQPIWTTLGAILQKNLPNGAIEQIKATNLDAISHESFLSVISDALEHNTYYQTSEFANGSFKTTFKKLII